MRIVDIANRPRYKVSELVLGFIRSPFIFLRALIGVDASHIELEEIEKYLGATPRGVIEAGAYDGRDTARMAIHWESSIIYAFEPIPELHSKIEEATKSIKNLTK